MKPFSTLLFVILLIFLLYSNRSSAAHMMGGDISYKCLGNDIYEITVKAYKDCNAPTSITNMPVVITPLGTGTPVNKSLSQVSVKDITVTCSSTIKSLCSGGTYPFGIEEYVFRGNIDLSTYTGSCKFRISWEQSVRSSSITTGMANQGFYMEAMIDKCLSSCNSSPVFSIPPNPFLCAGRDFCYSHGLIDTIDGDSLSYSLVDAQQNAGVTATYGSGYSGTSPLTYYGSPASGSAIPAGFHLDKISGELCFRPTAVQVGVVVVKVTEWRNINGTMTNIGEIMRDMQYVATSCNWSNKSPGILSPYEYEICAGNKLCFDISANDLDANDTVRISWNKTISDATFDTYFPSSGPGAKKQKATFCWTPTENDFRIQPYEFLAVAKDNFCPQPASNAKVFSITVKRQLKNAARTITNQGCGKVSFAAIPSDTGRLTYKWTISKDSASNIATDTMQNFAYNFAAAGRYYVTLELSKAGYCGIKFKDTLDVDTFLTVALLSDTVLCKGSPLTITSVTGSGMPDYRYQWSSSARDTFNVLNILVNNTASYMLTVTDSVNCSVTDTIKVTARAPLTNAGNDKKVCLSGGVHTLPGLPAGGSWTGAGISGITFDPVAAGTGTHLLIYSFVDSAGCGASDSSIYEVLPDPVINAGSDTAICKNKSLALKGTPANANGSWIGAGVAGSIFNSSALNPGNHTLIYTYTNGSGCTARDSMIVHVNALPVVNAGTDTAVCSNGGIISLSGVPAGGSWSGPGTTANLFDPRLFSGTKTFTYSFTDNQNCTNTDSREITVNAPPIVNAGADRTLCFDGAGLTLSGTPASGTWSGTGISGGVFNPSLAGKGNHKAFYRVVNSNGCSASDSIILRVVKPVADFSATPLSGNRPLNTGFTDMSSGAYQKLEWNFGDAGSQNTSVLKNPSHVYHLVGTYSVMLKVTDTTVNCSDSLTKVNYINVSHGIGINEINEAAGIYAYPNPASKSFEVFVNTAEGLYTLSMHDISGKKVKEVKDVKNGTLHVNCESLDAGLYFLQLSGAGREVFKTKIILE
jgi:PKD repeat protein